MYWPSPEVPPARQRCLSGRARSPSRRSCRSCSSSPFFIFLAQHARGRECGARHLGLLPLGRLCLGALRLSRQTLDLRRHPGQLGGAGCGVEDPAFSSLQRPRDPRLGGCPLPSHLGQRLRHLSGAAVHATLAPQPARCRALGRLRGAAALSFGGVAAFASPAGDAGLF